MNEEILEALKNVHLRLWEETLAPCGMHMDRAIDKRRIAERQLRGKLAKYNPRDIPEYNLRSVGESK